MTGTSEKTAWPQSEENGHSHLLALLIGNLPESTQRTSCKLIWEMIMSQESDSAAIKQKLQSQNSLEE